MEESNIIRGITYKVGCIVYPIVSVLAVIAIVCYGKYNNSKGYVKGWGYTVEEELLWPVYICIALIAVLLLFKYLYGSAEIVVTDKRVYGKVAFGRRVDLPLDSISSVGLGVDVLKMVIVASSSGSLKFSLIRNYREVYSAISKLLLERQGGNTNKKSERNIDSMEELTKIKKMLDEGLITQSDYELKKKQILDL